MTTIKEQEELTEKIVKGLDKAFNKLVESKKQADTDLVIMRDNVIVRLKADQL